MHSITHNQEGAGILLEMKCRIDGVKQSRVAEWLEKTLCCTLSEYLCANTLFSLSSYEYNRNFSRATLQVPLKLRSAHSRHSNIEDQATGPVDTVGRKEPFGGRKCTRCKAEFAKEVGQRFTHGLIVVND
jgi:hypothetical protein